MAVLIVDLGIALAVLGFLAVLLPRGLRRRLRLEARFRGLLLFLGGAALTLVGLLLPPPEEQRVIQRATLLDDWMPRYQFVERHEIRVQAPPERVYPAVLAVTAREIRLFRLLVWLRNPHFPWQRRDPVSILDPAADLPILESAVRGGFLPLDEERGKEVVLGTVVIAPRPRPADWGPHAFRQIQGPGFAKAAINFRVLPEPGGGCRVTTETRVQATDRASLRRFAAYWRLIYPGSWTIRWFWLRAIRDRAEGSAPAPAG